MYLTNERLGRRFRSQFELVNYAIRLAENMIRSGRGPRIKTSVQNLALLILDEIALGMDHFEEIPVDREGDFRSDHSEGRRERHSHRSYESVSSGVESHALSNSPAT